MMVGTGEPVMFMLNTPPAPTAPPDRCGGVGKGALTETDVELSPGFGSGVVALAMAEFCRFTPATLAWTVSTSCAPPPTASVPTFQVTSEPLRVTEVPGELLVAVSVNPAGNVSTT